MKRRSFLFVLLALFGIRPKPSVIEIRREVVDHGKYLRIFLTETRGNQRRVMVMEKNIPHKGPNAVPIEGLTKYANEQAVFWRPFMESQLATAPWFTA